jgi:hypothetical protein
MPQVKRVAKITYQDHLLLGPEYLKPKWEYRAYLMAGARTRRLLGFARTHKAEDLLCIWVVQRLDVTIARNLDSMMQRPSRSYSSSLTSPGFTIHHNLKSTKFCSLSDKTAFRNFEIPHDAAAWASLRNWKACEMVSKSASEKRVQVSVKRCYTTFAV